MKQVFIVHGHDGAALEDLCGCLTDLGLYPIVLGREHKNGMTLIEKFEQRAREADYAIILLTPDDKLMAPDENGSDETRARARQNVIFEMGWFFCRLGRDSTLLLHNGPVELPSDITGVLYMAFKDRPSELKADIARELENGGILLPLA